jgi:dihydroxyacetone kinase
MTLMKQFINTKEPWSTEAIDGLCARLGRSAGAAGRLSAHQGGGAHRLGPVAVALVSGGGSGHEPAMRASSGRGC